MAGAVEEVPLRVRGLVVKLAMPFNKYKPMGYFSSPSVYTMWQHMPAPFLKDQLEKLFAVACATVLNFSRVVSGRAFLEKPAVSRKTLHFFLYTTLLTLYLKVILKTERRSRRFLTLVQEARLRRLVVRAQQSPWWREYFQKHRINPADIKTVEDLEQLPVLTRADVASVDPKKLFTKNIGSTSVEWGQSSGSTTGTPVRWAFEKSLLRFDIAAFFFKQFYEYSLSFKEKSKGNFYADLNPVYTQKDAFHFFRGGTFYAFKEDPKINEKIYDICEKIEELGGCILNTAPSELFFFVEKLKELRLSPKIFFCRIGGLPLTQMDLRKDAEEYLGCPVREAYGAQEFGCLGGECLEWEGYMHIYAERAIFEVLDDRGKKVSDGEVGRIIITCLDNVFMPLVRYEVGDRGALFYKKNCSCKNKSALLRIEGRIAELLELSDGSKQSPKLIFKCIAQEPSFLGVKKIQVRQDRIDQVRILLETPGSFSERKIMEISQKISATYRNMFFIEICCVEQIPKFQNEAKFKQFVPLK